MQTHRQLTDDVVLVDILEEDEYSNELISMHSEFALKLSQPEIIIPLYDMAYRVHEGNVHKCIILFPYLNSLIPPAAQ